MKKDINSVMAMDKLVFDKIDFERIGLNKSSHEFSFSMQIMVGYSKKSDTYKVTLKMIGEKDEEYNLNISLIGFFTFTAEEGLDDQFKNNLIQKNAVAIMMPYLRSQVSLITAQPDVECVVLPTFNVNNMLSDE